MRLAGSLGGMWEFGEEVLCLFLFLFASLSVTFARFHETKFSFLMDRRIVFVGGGKGDFRGCFFPFFLSLICVVIVSVVYLFLFYFFHVFVYIMYLKLPAFPSMETSVCLIAVAHSEKWFPTHHVIIEGGKKL